MRLLINEQSDLDLHYLPFHLHLLNALLHSEVKLFHFRAITVIIVHPLQATSSERYVFVTPFCMVECSNPTVNLVSFKVAKKPVGAPNL